MPDRVIIIYNSPTCGRYGQLGEHKAVTGVLDAVSGVSAALEEEGYEVVVQELVTPVSLADTGILRDRAALIFNLFEGADALAGSEAAIAGLLAAAGVCFTGSPADAILLCENKADMKFRLRAHHVSTPDWQVLQPETCDHFALQFPSIVKPLGEHASHGIYEESVVRDVESLKRQVNWMHALYGRPALVETFLPGREFSVLVLGNEHPRVCPVEEIVYDLPPNQPRILSYQAKWVPEDSRFAGTRPVCPADISLGVRQEIKKQALASYHALGCRDYARVDMRQDNNNRTMVIDVNPNPDLSPQGGAALQAAAARLSYRDFVGGIARTAISRQNRMKVGESDVNVR